MAGLEVSRGHTRCAAHQRAEHEGPRVGPMLSMDDDEAQARAGADTPGVAGAGCGGQNPAGASDGAEPPTATAGRTKAEVATEALMEQVVERGNMWAAYERVLRNKGAPGRSEERRVGKEG